MVKIERFFAAISGLNLAVVFAVTFVQVIQRYVFNMSIPWATDIIRICFIYSVFGGMCVGVIKKLHLNIDVVAKLVPRKVSKILSLLSNYNDNIFPVNCSVLQHSLHPQQHGSIHALSLISNELRIYCFSSHSIRNDWCITA